MEMKLASELITLDVASLMRLQKNLNEIEARHRAGGANDAMQLIQNELIKSESPSSSSEDFQQGYNRALNDCFALIRDKLVFKKSNK